MAKRRTPIRSKKLRSRKPITNRVTNKNEKNKKRKIRTIKSTKTSLPNLSSNHPMWAGGNDGSLMGGGTTGNNMEMNHGTHGDDVNAGGQWEMLGIIAFGSQQECHCNEPPCLSQIADELGYFPLFLRQEGFECYVDEMVGNYGDEDFGVVEHHVGSCCWTETHLLAGGGPPTTDFWGTCGLGYGEASQENIDACVEGDYPAGLDAYECQFGGWADGGTNEDGSEYDEWWYDGLSTTDLSMAKCGPWCTEGIEGIATGGWMQPPQCCANLSGNGAGYEFNGIDSWVEVCPLQGGASMMYGGAYLPMKCWIWVSDMDSAGGHGRGG